MRLMLNDMKISLPCLFAVALAVSGCGADNYEDCVLEKMQGQDRSVLRMAEETCEKQFPYETKLYRYSDDIDVNWTNNLVSIILDINENRGKYQVTKYEASFSKNDCESSKDDDFKTKKTFIFPTNKNTTSAEKNFGEGDYQCMRTLYIWGKRFK